MKVEEIIEHATDDTRAELLTHVEALELARDNVMALLDEYNDEMSDLYQLLHGAVLDYQEAIKAAQGFCYEVAATYPDADSPGGEEWRARWREVTFPIPRLPEPSPMPEDVVDVAEMLRALPTPTMEKSDG